MKAKVKGKEAAFGVEAVEEARERREGRAKGRRTRRLPGFGAWRRGRGKGVFISSAMPTQVEDVLQANEPVTGPMWENFTNNLSGIWKGVGGVFSPLTAEMEPIGIGDRNEHLYDCITLSHTQKVQAEGQVSQIYRKTNWLPLDHFGEVWQSNSTWDSLHQCNGAYMHKQLASCGSLDMGKFEILDEDFIMMEPGLVFFEDGSYSRGPTEIPVGYYEESNCFHSSTFKFEQCLFNGHKRLRIVHTIGFNDGGANIEIVGVAAYEEQCQHSAEHQDISDLQCDLKCFSHRKRAHPSELSGSWKVLEVAAVPIFSNETPAVGGGLLYAYQCTETLKKRSLPDNLEEFPDLQDVSVLWLPGGITAHVDVNKDGILCIGAGWYDNNGVNLVMERDYGMDGRLREVRWKSEVRRWCDTLM